MTIESPRLPWYRLAGPWPLRPVVVFIFAWYFYVATAQGQLLEHSNVHPVEWFRGASLLAIPPATAMAIVVLLGRIWQKRHGERVGSYVVCILTAATAALVMRVLVGAVPTESLVAPLPLLFGLVRTAVMLVLTLSIAGVLTARLQRQVAATQDALDQVKDQQQLMLEADESARRQVAALLHDRVQAGLIAACLELQMHGSSSAACDQDAIRQVVERLELLRTLDVRRAARALSPDLHDVDLQSALEELAAQYEPAMGTRVVVSPEVDARRSDFGDEVVLGVYRIVEQALMNSAHHGRARHVRVGVSVSDSVVAVGVEDDGRGLDSARGQGLGSAVLNTWTRHFEGSWSIVDAPSGGAVLRVTLHLPAA